MMLAFFVIFGEFYLTDSQDPRNCSWVGINGMPGAFMPVDVCMSQAAYGSLSSSKYICASNGTFVYQYHWNNTLCQDPAIYKEIKYTNTSHFHCGGGLCPHAIMRFYDKEHIEGCKKNASHWAEAIFTTYQCLHNNENPQNWFKLTCTEDGSQLIDNSYDSTNCQNLNHSDIYDEGCLYKDKYIEVLHCDYWNTNTSPPTNIPTMQPTQNGGDSNKHKDLHTPIMWIIVVCILVVIIMFMAQVFIRNKMKGKRVEFAESVTTDNNDKIINKNWRDHMDYDKIVSEERKTETVIDDIHTMNNGEHKSVSSQKIVSDTSQTSLLNND